MNPIEDAKNFIESHFQCCQFALVAGSVIRGEGTKTSDLDIVVIDLTISKAYRESFMKFGWPIEVFVHNQQSLKEFFLSDVGRRRPSLVKMISEGVILRDSTEIGQELKAEANELLRKGPEPFSEKEAKLERYFITEMLDDLIGTDRFEEEVFIINELVERLCNFILVNNQEWVGRGKWIPCLIKKFDQRLYNDLMTALEDFYSSKNKELIKNFVERELDRYGGRYFEGFSIGKN
jgi:hypothetical protein